METKYEEALRKAREKHRKFIEQEAPLAAGLLEEIFPELTESEDERIRKWIIEELEITRDAMSGKNDYSDDPDIVARLKRLDEAIAWLEKQKEQKPVEKQDYSGLTDLERAIHRGFLCAGVENVPVVIIKETAQDCLVQIKPMEWSDEDEKMCEHIISDLREFRDCETDEELISDYEDEIQWLKDRLKSLRPQLQWKPSEEQMRWLEIAYRKSEDKPTIREIIGSLLNDLKKLM